MWGTETIHAVRDLLAVGPGPGRGPRLRPRPRRRPRTAIAVTRPSAGRARTAGGRPIPRPATARSWCSGRRVALGGGAVVLPWREELRYGPRKAGYHGGAAPAEAVIPLLVLSAGDEDAVPGWAGAPVASPSWWREAPPDSAPPTVPPATAPIRGRPTRDAAQPGPPAAGRSVVRALAPTPVAPVRSRTGGRPRRPALVDALLASEIYRQRRGDRRARLPDDRVAALLARSARRRRPGHATTPSPPAPACPPTASTGTVTALRRLLQVEGYPVARPRPRRDRPSSSTSLC